MVTITEKLKKEGIDILAEYPNIIQEKVRAPENVIVVLKSAKKKKTMDLR